MNGTAPVAIVLSTYNGARYLEAQLRSLSDQSEREWTLLVRDDGSSDATLDMLRAASRQDDRIRLVEDGLGNLGPCQSFARLIQYVRTTACRYLMLCDQDDVWHADKIERTLLQMRRAEEADAGRPTLVHTDLRVVDAGGNPLHPSFWAYSGMDPHLNALHRLLVQNTVTGCTAMINRPLLDALDPFPPQAILHDWWIALVAAALGRIAVMPGATIDYRVHGGNVAGVRAIGSWTSLPARWARACSAASRHAVRERLLGQACRQSGALATAYAGRLDADTYRLLNAVAGLDGLGWTARKRLLFQERVLRQRLRHNLSLLLMA